MRQLTITSGDVFNRLTVLQELPRVIQPSGQPKRCFLFQCICGKKVEATLDNVKSQKIKSCGCLNKENKLIHGESKNPLTKIWYGMHERCSKHPGYFGRGICVCPEWTGEQGLLAFIGWASEIKTYAPNKDIDREDNNLGYSPSNCRFVTKSINQRNRRDALLVTHPLTQKPISLITLWESEGNPNIAWETVRSRYLYLNWSVLDSINKSAKGKK